MEKRGIATERGNINRAVSAINQKLRQIVNAIVHFKDQIKNVFVPTAKPSFAAILQSVVEGYQAGAIFCPNCNERIATRYTTKLDKKEAYRLVPSAFHKSGFELKCRVFPLTRNKYS